MTRNQANKFLAAILTTALETEPAPFPETMAYLAMGSNVENWQTIRRIMDQGELATFTGNSIALTDKGRDIARQCQQFQTA